MSLRLLTRSLQTRHRTLYSATTVRFPLLRTISDDALERKAKYMDKLRQRAEESGVTLEALLEKAKTEVAERRKAEGDLLKSTIAAAQKSPETPYTAGPAKDAYIPQVGERKDAPPYKPLSSILNLNRILETPHTLEQISALWTAYHASRSGGSGRGFVCAAISVDQYAKLEVPAKRYPTFVIPLPRVQPVEEGKTPSGEEVAYEFFFVQWDFHSSPPIPTALDDPFVKPSQTTAEGRSNPQTSTVLFTPLQEYKLRGSFATPYLILTIYTDLAVTHGLVLLRGEITPSPTDPTKYLLPQLDAQALAMSLQKFYLWSQTSEMGELPEGQRLLRAFHESPEEFKWEELLKVSKLTE